MNNLEKIITIVGPTASGKTDISIQVAKSVAGEIVSADSRLVYKDFDIGTAKPLPEELASVKHHMINVAEPTDFYTVSVYRDQADNVINNLFSIEKVPIVAGGTGFYVRTLLEGLNIPDVTPDDEFREEMELMARQQGKQVLYDRLKVVDPKMAQKLHPNDTFRIIRALEVYKNLGKPMSEMQTMSEPRYNAIYVGLTSENRDYLYERINQRVDIMYEAGLVEEVNNLINKYGKTLSLLKTLGYKEICDYIDGVYTIDQAIELIKKNTRNFAKRQLTWFRANKNIKWLYIDKMSKDEIIEEIIRIYNERI